MNTKNLNLYPRLASYFSFEHPSWQIISCKTRTHSVTWLHKRKGREPKFMDAVTSRLRTLSYKDQDLIDSGLVSGVFTDGESIRITLEKPSLANLEDLKQQIQGALSDLGRTIHISVATVAPKIPYVKRIISVMAGKGGVGKSTISFHLGKELARHGFRVGLLDADISGPSVPQMVNSYQKPEIDAIFGKILPNQIAWSNDYESCSGLFMSLGLLVPQGASIALRGPMVHQALKQMLFDVVWGTVEQPLDCLIIDMPPGTNDTHLSLLKMAKPDEVILVSTPDILSLIDVERTIHMLHKTNTSIAGIIENMSYFKCKHCNHDSPVFNRDTVESFAERLNIPFLGIIPIDSRMRHNDSTMPRYMHDICKRIKGVLADVCAE
jgi:ATP-binding protein involved in chromosome partitioning